MLATEPSTNSPAARDDRDRRRLARARTGDEHARDEILVSLAPLIRAIAWRYARDRDDLDELLQVGTLGALKALDRFDLSRTSALTAFVAPTVSGEIRRHLRDTTWKVHVPRDVRETAWRLPRAADRLRTDLRREPHEHELASELGVSVGRVRDARLARAANRPTTVARTSTEPGDGHSDVLELLGGDDDAYGRCDDRQSIRTAMRHLRQPERVAIGLAYVDCCSQREIGVVLGCSQMQVSRILDGALEKLRSSVVA